MAGQVDTEATHEYIPYFADKGKYPGYFRMDPFNRSQTDRHSLSCFSSYLFHRSGYPRRADADQYDSRNQDHDGAAVQCDVHAPWDHPDFSCCYPGCTNHFRKFFSADPYRQPGHGFPAAQSFHLVSVYYRRGAGPDLHFFGGGAVDTGWTFYVPFSLKTTVNVPLATFCRFHPWYVLDPYRNQYCHDGSPAAGARYGLFQNASFGLGLLLPQHGCRSLRRRSSASQCSL